MSDANTPMSHFEFDALRGVGRVELSLVKDQRVYALFGSNGVGKTKCLEALFQYYLLGNKVFRRELLVAGIFVAEQFYGDGYVIDISADGLPNKSYFYDERTKSSSDTRHSMQVVFLGASQRGHIEKKNVESLPIRTFEDRRNRYFQYLVSGMVDDFASLGMNSGLEQWFVTRAQSANPYQKSSDNRQIEIDTLLQLLSKVDDRYDPAFMQIDGANHVSLRIDGQVTELQHLSTGFTSLLKMLQAIVSGYANFTNEVNLAHVRGIVLIDEIESHLHVEWQSKIVLLLKQLFPNTTFYIATHSPLVLTQLEEGEAYKLKRDERDGVVRSHPIAAPNRQALVDILDEGFGVNVNALKRERMSAQAQAGAKQRLRALLNDEGPTV